MSIKPSKSKLVRFIAASIITLAVAGVLLAEAGKQRETTATISLELCKKGTGGQWEVIDRATAPANFTASIIDLAGGGKELSTSINWNTRSEKGRQINVKLPRAAKVNFNPTSGLLELDTAFDVTVDGLKLPLNAKLTTGSVSSPTGQLSGKKANLNVAARTLTADVVGFSSIKQRDAVDRLLGGPNANRLLDQSKAKKEELRSAGKVGGTGIIDELVVVFKGGGRVVAK